ncbi:MAG: 50S ribosomal protein L3, partial [candidate division Zixibacteria bacterium]|nr:50S ribosomal protein L3 [candidate division Zixibacteria bacterium]
SVGDKVDITGVSKGLGFQGVVRRHKFSGGPKTHGQSDRLRAPGSVGSSSYPSRTYKGQRMAGRMGNERVTVRNLEVVGVDEEKNILLVKGAVPGKKNSILLIKKIR